MSMRTWDASAKDRHFSLIGASGYAKRDFAMRDYFEKSLIPHMRALALREGQPMQASFRPDVGGTWDIRNAEDQPISQAFVIVAVDGTWRKGPKFDEGFFTTHDGHEIEDCGECAARRLDAMMRGFPIGSRVQVVASDLPEHVRLEGRVMDWSAPPRSEPLVTVAFDEPIASPDFVRRHGERSAREDGFRMEDLRMIGEGR